MESITTLAGLSKLSIVQAQLVTAAGTDTAQILAEVMNEFPHARAQQGWFTHVNVSEPTEIIAADIETIDSTDPTDRMLDMLLVWLEQITWPEHPPEHIYLLAPVDLTTWLQKKLPNTNAQWHWFNELIPCLNDWNTRLENSPPSHASDQPSQEANTLLIALDSQIQPEPWYDQRGDLYHEHNQDGRLVGEGLAALWLQETATPTVTGPLYYCREPKAALAAEDTTYSLKSLFDQAPTATFSALLSNHSPSRLHACELHYFTSQVTQARRREAQPADTPSDNDLDDNLTVYHYPRAIEPPLNDSPANLAASLGDTGLATLPMQLALVHLSQRYANQMPPWQALIHLCADNRFYWPMALPEPHQTNHREAQK
ncbi:MAG: hypothetical protein P8X74_18145 [Reinekea sp.]